MCEQKSNLEPQKLKEYFENEIFVTESSLAYWNRRPNHVDQDRMLRHWQTVKDVLVKCKEDILGADAP